MNHDILELTLNRLTLLIVLPGCHLLLLGRLKGRHGERGGLLLLSGLCWGLSALLVLLLLSSGL